MKILAMLSAGLSAATVTLPAAAPAQSHSERVVTRTVVHTERRSGYSHNDFATGRSGSHRAARETGHDATHVRKRGRRCPAPTDDAASPRR